jgi:hypothetical protein
MTDEQRFWLSVNKDGPIPLHAPELGACWLWEGGCSDRGYGYFHLGASGGYKIVRVHRFSYEMEYGPIPTGIKILHKCDNPRCCNPQHTKGGSLQENTRDMISKGRHGEYRHLSLEVAREIRKLYATGEYSQRELSEKFNLSTHTIVGRIVRNETWVEEPSVNLAVTMSFS